MAAGARSRRRIWFSADSRVPRDEEEVEQLPVGDILGRPIGFTWLSAKFGKAIH